VNWREIKQRAYDHGIEEGGLYHDECLTCTALKQDVELLRMRDLMSKPRPMVEGDIMPTSTVDGRT